MSIKSFVATVSQTAMWAICNFVGRRFLSLKVCGEENLKNIKTGNVVFVANHFGELDAFFIGASMPSSFLRKTKIFRQMTKAALMKKKWYGPLIWMMGAYPVSPALGDYEKALRKTCKILRDGQSVLIFPTGKIGERLDPRKARPGIAYLAKKLDPQLVPVYISGTHKLTPGNIWRKERKVAVSFGRPFFWREAADESDDPHTAAEKIMGRVKELEK